MTPSNRKAGHRRLVDMGTPETGWSPELPPVDEWEQQFALSENADYIQRFGYDEWNRLASWAVIQMRRDEDGTWRRVAHYDVCHNKGLHIHLFNRQQEEFTQVAIRQVQSYEESERALDYALERVVMHWQENERRSDRGR